MGIRTRGFLLTLAASAGAAALSGAAAALLISSYPPGSGGAAPALWVVVALPAAAALAAAGALARSRAAVLLNSLAYVLPQLAAALGVFFLFAHPGGAGGQGLVLATAEFWFEVAAAYLGVALLVGGASFAFGRARR